MKGSLHVTALVAVLLMFGAVASAQHQHVVKAEKIDGHEHPERIPDVLAYGRFFLERSVSANPDQMATEMQNRLIFWMHFNTGDELQFRLEMAKFRPKFDALVAEYNRKTEKGLAIPTLFYTELFRLTKETHGNLKQSLSPEGLQAISTGVLLWKKRSTYEVLGNDVPTEVIQ